MARESAGNLKFSADSGIHGIQLFECIFFTIFYNSTIFMCINMHALTKKNRFELYKQRYEPKIHSYHFYSNNFINVEQNQGKLMMQS